jgi:hypothetical protein
MNTHVSVNTYTHSVTYVTGQMLGSIKQIIKWCGLDPAHLLDEWEILERGISCWIGSKHLKRLSLEIFNPSTDSLVGRWDFDINYSYGSSDDGSMWADTDAIRHAIAKAGIVASTCKYGIIASCPGGASVAGWGTASYRSTAGFTQHGVGTTIGANSLGSNASFWRKS